MRQHVVRTSALLAALFIVIPSHAFSQTLLRCSAGKDLSATFAQARELAAGIPVIHSDDIVSYRETLVGPKGPYPRPPQKDYRSRAIPLTLLRPETGELRTTSVTRVIENGKLPTLLFSDDHAFVLAVESRPSGTVWNWWNTSLTVLAPQGWVVAAIHWKRYPSGVSLTYTPFSASLALALPDVIALGERHIETDLASAFAILRNVPSALEPNVSVAEMIERRIPSMARVIMAVEHADPYDVQMFRNGFGSFDPLHRASVIFGTNGNEAFSITRSSAGALGIMQVMPRTWKEVRDHYPEAHLPSWDRLPEHSHPFEMVAGLLTVDMHLRMIANYGERRGVSLEQLLSRSDLQTLALASFNGGPRRVGVQLGNPKWRASLQQETRDYLHKFDAFEESAR
jgi:hypothetical protein